MKLSFNTKIMLTLLAVGILCTGAAVLTAVREINRQGEDSLVDKSRAILSRLDVGAKYVAQMNTMDGVIQETLQKHPDGRVPDEQKLKILKSVPVYAAFQIGKQGSEEEHYRFRVASDAPRNKDNQASPEELGVIAKFRTDPALREYVFKSPDGKFITVVGPSRISQSHGCLTCHGAPATSPWKNGKDILGFQMENMKDGDLRGTFAIVSSLDAVQAEARASAQMMILIGLASTLVLLGLAYIFIRKPIRQLGSIAKQVGESSHEVNSTSESLASASQQLAASSQEQASSVEEVSSSLEEISGMVSSALKGSHESVELSQKVSALVVSSTESMSELQRAVNQIAEGNARVERLVKLIEEIGEKTELIDEIVFQTRLLSFNASVEAERAGEHGRGFAVVAQEVGNLAQMSGKSATEIAAIVKNSIKEAQEVAQMNKSKVEQGVQLCKKTAQQLESIEKASKEILAGAEQILRASEEQNSGIQQINQSIQLISQSTQENASAAEQCSGGSQSLTAQGESLETVVGDLEELVYGKKQQAPAAAAPPVQNARPSAKVVPFKKAAVSAPKKIKPVAVAKASGGDDPWEKI